MMFSFRFTFRATLPASRTNTGRVASEDQNSPFVQSVGDNENEDGLLKNPFEGILRGDEDEEDEEEEDESSEEEAPPPSKGKGKAKASSSKS